MPNNRAEHPANFGAPDKEASLSVFTAEGKARRGGVGLLWGGSATSHQRVRERGSVPPLPLTAVVPTLLSPLWAWSPLVSSVGEPGEGSPRRAGRPLGRGKCSSGRCSYSRQRSD